jgi:hypothetical protein
MWILVNKIPPALRKGCSSKILGFQATKSPLDFPIELTTLIIQFGKIEYINFLAFSSEARVYWKK